MKDHYAEVCRMCGGSDLEMFLDLGSHTLMNSLVREDELTRSEDVYPLHVVFCHDCHLVQLGYVVDSNKIYRGRDYLYFSSDMPTLRKYFAEYATEVTDKHLKDGDLVVEIASNDGIFLDLFPSTIRVLGIDPATNVVLRALKRGIPTVSEFFTEDLVRSVAREWGAAQVIVGSNCIAHIDDLHDVMRGIRALLRDTGVFCLECNYWGAMVRNVDYSLIYLDHFSFFSVETWQTFASRFGLRVFDGYVTPAQGGSLRLFLAADGRVETDRLKALGREEAQSRLNTLATCQEYARRVNRRREELGDVLRGLKRAGKRIMGYGAAAKGLSLLKCSGIGRETIESIVHDSPAKQGLYTPESHIPVVRREATTDPDYFVVLAPNYSSVIVGKEQPFVRRGGRFIVPKSDIEIFPA